MIGKFLKEGSKHAAHALVFGKFLKRQSGARLLTSSETDDLLSSRNTGLLIDGDQGRLSERESFQNVAVMARVGAGKTSRYIIPNVLDRAKRNCSIVVNDPKGEVFAETSGYLQSRGFKVIAINPEDLDHSSRFNPLLEAKTDIEIEQVAEILVKPDLETAKMNFGAMERHVWFQCCLSFCSERDTVIPAITLWGTCTTCFKTLWTCPAFVPPPVLV